MTDDRPRPRWLLPAGAIAVLAAGGTIAAVALSHRSPGSEPVHDSALAPLPIIDAGVVVIHDVPPPAAGRRRAAAPRRHGFQPRRHVPGRPSRPEDA